MEVGSKSLTNSPGHVGISFILIGLQWYGRRLSRFPTLKTCGSHGSHTAGMTACATTGFQRRRRILTASGSHNKSRRATRAEEQIPTSVRGILGLHIWAHRLPSCRPVKPAFVAVVYIAVLCSMGKYCCRKSSPANGDLSRPYRCRYLLAYVEVRRKHPTGVGSS